MTARELHTRLQSDLPPRLIQVLPEEIHAASRLPGARNACVYEMSFLDQFQALGITPSAPLVVYGAGEGSLDARTAVEKLRAAGYSQVQSFEGGLAEWKAAGLPLEGSGHLPQPPVPDGTYAVDTAASVIRWTGRNLFNQPPAGVPRPHRHHRRRPAPHRPRPVRIRPHRLRQLLRLRQTLPLPRPTRRQRPHPPPRQDPRGSAKLKHSPR